jgi:hypothetical protein
MLSLIRRLAISLTRKASASTDEALNQDSVIPDNREKLLSEEKSYGQQIHDLLALLPEPSVDPIGATTAVSIYI